MLGRASSLPRPSTGSIVRHAQGEGRSIVTPLSLVRTQRCSVFIHHRGPILFPHHRRNYAVDPLAALLLRDAAKKKAAPQSIPSDEPPPKKGDNKQRDKDRKHAQKTAQAAKERKQAKQKEKQEAITSTTPTYEPPAQSPPNKQTQGKTDSAAASAAAVAASTAIGKPSAAPGSVPPPPSSLPATGAAPVSTLKRGATAPDPLLTHPSPVTFGRRVRRLSMAEIKPKYEWHNILHTGQIHTLDYMILKDDEVRKVRFGGLLTALKKKSQTFELMNNIEGHKIELLGYLSSPLVRSVQINDKYRNNYRKSKLYYVGRKDDFSSAKFESNVHSLDAQDVGLAIDDSDDEDDLVSTVIAGDEVKKKSKKKKKSPEELKARKKERVDRR